MRISWLCRRPYRQAWSPSNAPSLVTAGAASSVITDIEITTTIYRLPSYTYASILYDHLIPPVSPLSLLPCHHFFSFQFQSQDISFCKLYPYVISKTVTTDFTDFPTAIGLLSPQFYFSPVLVFVRQGACRILLGSAPCDFVNITAVYVTQSFRVRATLQVPMCFIGFSNIVAWPTERENM